MITILIINAVASGTALAGLLGVAARRRRTRRRVRRIYVTVDGRQITRSEPL